MKPHLPGAALIVSLALILAACSGNPPQAYQYYLLATPAADDRSMDGEMLARVAVILPGYLNQTGIVLVSAQRQLSIASFNLWAEPLDEGIGRLLRDRLSALRGADSFALQVTVNYLHSTDEGEALLDANWTLSDSCGDSTSGRFTGTLRQPVPGYSALAETQAHLVAELAQSIAEASASLSVTACSQ